MKRLACFLALVWPFLLAAQTPQNVTIQGNIPITINGLPNGCIASATGTVVTVASCPVSGAPVAVNMNCGATQLQIGQQMSCTATVQNATNISVIFTSSAPSVATVNTSGQVTGLTIGTTNIVATSVQDGTKSATFPISVIAATNAPAYIHGSVSAGYNTTTGSSTLAFNYHQPAAQGDILLCGVNWHDGVATATVADSINGAYTMLNGAAVAGVGTLSGWQAAVFMLPSAKYVATTNKITVTLSKSITGILAECVEYAPAILDGIPGYSNAHAANGILMVGGPSTKNINDTIVGFCLAVTNACSVGAGFTMRNDQNAWNAATNSIGGNFLTLTGQGIEDRIINTQGAQQATFGTTSANDDALSAIVTLAPAGTVVAHSVTLNWAPSAVSTPDCISSASCPIPPGTTQCYGPPDSYYIYRSATSGVYTTTPYSVIPAGTSTPSYVDIGVKGGETWYYRVTAFKSAACVQESGPSNEVKAVVPIGLSKTKKPKS